MIMRSIFQKPKLKGQHSRNAFDRSSDRVFHSPFGALLPIKFWRLQADDYVELSVTSQFVCDTLVRPAFMRLKEHFDFYAVPYSQLYTPFENFNTSQDNYWSSAISYVQENQNGAAVPQRVPTIDGNGLARMLAKKCQELDVHGFNRGFGSLRLLDLLGYGNYYAMSTYFLNDDPADTSLIDNVEKVNFFNLLAYQKIYYDFYRNPKYEKNDVKAFNIDDLVNTLNVGDSNYSSYLNRLSPCFNMHYAWARKDYFTQVQPTILVDSNTIGFIDMQEHFPAPSNDVFTLFGIPGAQETSTYGNVVSSIGHKNGNSGLAVSQGQDVQAASVPNIAAIRFGFALDKLLRRMREAGGTFDKQMLAQYGVVPFDERHGVCKFIGGQTNRLGVTDVMNQTLNDNKLGYLGGSINQVNKPQRTFKYHAKEPCIVICMYHVSVDNTYPSYYIDRCNIAQTRFDWANPAFENLGLQPIFKFELLNLEMDQTAGSFDPAYLDSASANRKILGYVPRYSEYKTDVSRICGLFNRGLDESFAPWVNEWTPLYLGTGDYSPVTVAPLSKSTLTLNPMQMDKICGVHYDGTWETDQFKNYVYFGCKCISNLSVHGEDF